VWTTGVSNPVCSPHFRNSASVITKRVAFAIDIPENISRFHPYTFNSTLLYFTLVPRELPVRAAPRDHPGRVVYISHGPMIRICITGSTSPSGCLPLPPFYSLRRIIRTHARPSRITAAAGTRFAGTIQEISVIILSSVKSLSINRIPLAY